jgi:hypothetical protein
MQIRKKYEFESEYQEVSKEEARGIYWSIGGPIYELAYICRVKLRVFRRDSPPTRSRRSTGSGGESSSMLTSVERNAVQAFSGFYN